MVMVDLVKDEGEEYMPYAVLLGGMACILCAFLRCANLMILISSSVMIGFVNGLALIMTLAQVCSDYCNSSKYSSYITRCRTCSMHKSASPHHPDRVRVLLKKVIHPSC